MDSPATATLSPFIPASRQKNCYACVQAKRRCDRRTPICSRCIEKKTTCVYTKKRPVSQIGRSDIGSDSQPDGPAFENSDTSVFGSLDIHDGPTAGPLSSPPQDTTCFDYPPFLLDSDIPMGNFIDFIGSSNQMPISDNWLAQPHDSLVIERPGTPVDKEIMSAYKKMDTTYCDSSNWTDAQDPTSPMYYVIQRVKDFVKNMATNNATPFLHRRLYSSYTPQSILSCFSTTVLYTNRTPATTSMMMRSLQSCVRDLISTETERIIATPVDKLARTQALFIYQIIRLFDGDITLRAQGEKDLQLLETWVTELCKIRDNMGNLVQLEYGAIKGQPPKEWQKWIFAESLRRTIVIIHATLCLYEMLKTPDSCDDDDLGPWAFVHRWTLSKPLWEANSSFDFQRAWKDNFHFIISNFSFENFLKNGRAEDVDEFAEILLNVYIGPDALKEFMTHGSRDDSRPESLCATAAAN
ncbi:hypothetical protein F5Y16DRAFT_320686 [Xylariaceae sp. FL0255]|nr:hypothetical protein F5Y16DRAFT_320686 [Xylariaceae sp. FL0255]